MDNFSLPAQTLSISRVIGKKVVDLSSASYQAIRAEYNHVIADLGTGDGKHIFRWAKDHPEDLCLGIDSSGDALSKTSGKTILATHRGGVPNCIFIRSAAQSLPQFLGPFDQIHILMPWGSLLRDVITPGETGDKFLTVLRSLSYAGTEIIVTLNLHAWRPRVPEVGDTREPDLEFIEGRLAQWYRDYGFAIHFVRYAHSENIQEFSTSWTKRIAASKTEFSILYFQATFMNDIHAESSKIPMIPKI